MTSAYATPTSPYPAPTVDWLGTTNSQAPEYLSGIDSLQSRIDRVLLDWYQDHAESMSSNRLYSIILLLEQVASASSTLPVAVTSPSRWSDTWSLPSLPQLIAIIQARFGLSISDTARVLGVGRPTVYSWIRDTALPNDDNQRRIFELYQLAQSLSELDIPAYALRAIRGPLVETLSDQTIDRQAVVAVLEEGLTIRNSAKPSVRQRSDEAGVFFRPPAEHMERIAGSRVSPGDNDQGG